MSSRRDVGTLQAEVFKAILLSDTLHRLEEAGISVHGGGPPAALAQIELGDFSPIIRQRAIQMQHVYVAFFCLENAARELIEQRLRERHQANWWSLRVPQKIRDAVAKLKEKEKTNRYHAKRSSTEIGYTLFGQLGQIIIACWDDFADLFPDQAWVTSRFNDLEMSRNIIMHTNTLPDEEVERIDSIVRDWLKQVG